MNYRGKLDTYVVVVASPQFYSAAFQASSFHRFAVPLPPRWKGIGASHQKGECISSPARAFVKVLS